MGGLQEEISNKADMYRDQTISEWGSVHFGNLNTVAFTDLEIQGLKHLFVKVYLKSTI